MLVRYGSEGASRGFPRRNVHLLPPPLLSLITLGLEFKLVFGPSAEKRAIAQGTVIREFPRCPICKATYGYEVSGSSLDHFKCNTCQSKWQTEPLADGSISSMTLVQPSA